MRWMLPTLAAAAMVVGGATLSLRADHHEEPAPNTLTDAEREAGWVLMFNGEDLDGWKMSEENADSVSVADGKIVTNGPCGHLFYGEDGNAQIGDFEFKADVYCDGPSNSGIYIRTRYQRASWPDYGFECQVANGYGDPRKTASLYAIADLAESPAEDDAWFHYHIKVEGNRVRIWIDGELAQDWTQPDDWDNDNRSLDNPGTFALQAHDPGSTVLYYNIKYRPLGDE